MYAAFVYSPTSLVYSPADLVAGHEIPVEQAKFWKTLVQYVPGPSRSMQSQFSCFSCARTSDSSHTLQRKLKRRAWTVPDPNLIGANLLV